MDRMTTWEQLVKSGIPETALWEIHQNTPPPPPPGSGPGPGSG
ncbi:unnamed protein product [[Actinomadura] parvosata subsp. kistnae]|nr:unnamed protein product [Actinomadura parvosata subsp. kistnae]